MGVFPGRRSVFFAWLLSYSVIVVILVALSAAVYLEARRILVGEIEQAKGATLRQAAQAINSRLEDVERLKLQASWNPRVTSFLSLKAPIGLSDRYALFLLSRDFVIYKASHTFVESMFVFFHDSDIVLSSETVCSSTLFHELYVREDMPSYRDWLSLVKGNHEGDFVRVGDELTYMQSLPPDPHMAMSATLVIRMDRQWLTSTLKAVAWSERESIVIVDQSDRLVAAAGGGRVPEGLRYAELREGAAVRLSGRAGGTLLVSTVKLSPPGWKIASVMPSNAFTRRVTYLQNLTILGLLICLAAGGATAYTFARRNYNHISEVATEMAALAGIPVDRGNEYQVLRAAVAATLEQRERLDSSLRQYNAAMKQNFVRRLVRGRFASVVEVEESFADFGVVPYSPYYAVFIVYIEGSGGDPADRNPGLRLASFILANSIEAIIERQHRGLVTEIDDMLACVVNLRLLSAPEWNRDLDAIVDEARRHLRAAFELESTVGLSTIHSDVAGIPDCYQEALDALEYKLVAGPGRVIRFDETRERRSVYTCPLETERQLLNAVRAGDDEQAGAIFDELFERNFLEAEPSVQAIKCFVFDMYNLLLKVAATAGPGRQHAMADMVQPLVDVLSRTRDLEDLRAEVRGTVAGVCRTLGNLKKDDRLALEIRGFVESQYARRQPQHLDDRGPLRAHPGVHLASLQGDDRGEPAGAHRPHAGRRGQEAHGGPRPARRGGGRGRLHERQRPHPRLQAARGHHAGAIPGSGLKSRKRRRAAAVDTSRAPLPGLLDQDREPDIAVEVLERLDRGEEADRRGDLHEDLDRRSHEESLQPDGDVGANVDLPLAAPAVFEVEGAVAARGQEEVQKVDELVPADDAVVGGEVQELASRRKVVAELEVEGARPVDDHSARVPELQADTRAVQPFRARERRRSQDEHERRQNDSLHRDTSFDSLIPVAGYRLRLLRSTR